MNVNDHSATQELVSQSTAPLAFHLFTVKDYAMVLRATIQGAYARRNVTVDDNDPGIFYARVWGPSASTQLDFGGSHMLTQDPGVTATIVFTGVSIFFPPPLRPYLVNTALLLDGSPPILVDPVDHSPPTADGGLETVASVVVWRATGLDNARRTLVVSVSAGQPFVVIDGLMCVIIPPVLQV
ncbi:hypothetical protein BDQ17DRAFT_1422740 [Cyathus striatus]|nr:hypothetical protein BDQ17DRAFT_1422740 [Cyathus striatus]